MAYRLGGGRLHWLLWESALWRPSLENGMSWIWHLLICWWCSCSGALESVEYLFIPITPWSTLASINIYWFCSLLHQFITSVSTFEAWLYYNLNFLKIQSNSLTRGKTNLSCASRFTFELMLFIKLWVK